MTSCRVCLRSVPEGLDYHPEPLIEVRKLFKVFLFSWWVSNGDQHLKNFGSSD